VTRPRFEILFAALLAGCATPPPHPQATSQLPAPQNPPSGSTSDVQALQRVALPYTFIRHGVEIRVYSVESGESNVLVNLVLQETKGQSFDFPLTSLLQIAQASGQTMPYSGYSIDGKTHGDPAIHLVGHDQISLTLAYHSSSNSAGTPKDTFELRFPTKKYWSSQTSATE
jgi:hypothetical protein